MHDHANQVEMLAQIAYSRIDERRSMADEAFFKMLNNVGLQHYFLATKVDSIEGAVEMGKAYYQVEGPPPGSRFHC